MLMRLIMFSLLFYYQTKRGLLIPDFLTMGAPKMESVKSAHINVVQNHSI